MKQVRGKNDKLTKMDAFGSNPNPNPSRNPVTLAVTLVVG